MSYLGQFVMPSNGSPWVAENASIPKQAPPSPASLMFRHIFRKDGTLEEIKEILNTHTAEEIMSWRSGGHPVLHEACEQFTYGGAQLVLQAFFEDYRLKGLFTNHAYVDKYGGLASGRLGHILSRGYWREPSKPNFGLPSIVVDIAKEFNLSFNLH